MPPQNAGPGQFGTQKSILDDGQLGEQRQFLVDGRDTGSDGIRGTIEGNVSSGDS